MFTKDEAEVRVEIWTITPEMAEKLLATNFDNRRERAGTSARYGRDMAAGNWRFNGDAIRLNAEGELEDGQHRLRGCILSNCAFKTLVVIGLRPEDRVTLDTGAKRSMTDVLRWRGETSQALLAAVISWCVRYETGNFRNPQFNPSHAELLAWLDANPGIRESVKTGYNVRRQVMIPASAVAGVHYQSARFNRADADVFMEQLRTGAGLDARSPVLALRGWATRMADRRDKPESLVYAAVLIKAMNAWREGRAVSVIGWRAGGAQAEKFPTLVAEIT